jgi:DNA helicase-2/ATP-dependent DNA helicase PcrA
MARLRLLASEFEQAHSGDDIGAFVAELGRRFSTEHSGRGVNLLTYHRAKGLEFDAVCLPRLVDGELPWRSGRAKANPEEERRLLYVGITRARRYLFLTWPTDGRVGRSPFLEELEVVAPSARGSSRGRAPVSVRSGGALFDRLKEWRRKRAQADNVPAYVVFHDRTLVEIAEQKPSDWADLAGIAGIGPAKLERYADEVLQVIATT